MTPLLKQIQKWRWVKLYKRLWPFVKPFWGRCLLSVLITIPIGALDAVMTLALKPFTDTVVLSKGSATPWGLPLWVIPLGIILFTVLQGILEYGAAYLNTWTGGKITQEMQRKLYQKLMFMDQGFYDKCSSGDLAQRFNLDPAIACSGLLNNVKVFTTRVFSSLALIGVLFYTSWKLAIFAIVILGGALWPLAFIRRMIKDVVKKSVEVGASGYTVFNETHAGAKTIASYNLQEIKRDQFYDILKQAFKLSIKTTQRTAWLTPMMHVIIAFGMAGAIWFGSHLITTNQMTVGDFVAFMASMLALYTPIKSIGKNFNQIQLSFMAVERVCEMLDYPINIKDKKDAKELKSIQKEIVFKGVDFEYIPDVPVLKDINLVIPKGKTVAFVGNSGGGKSTIASLIPRFYDVQKGSIQIDGTDIRNLTLHSLRQHIATVFQDNFLFSGTIRDNLLLGNPNASEKEINKAIEMACLKDFIDELEKGLDTPIGERGTLLSGGQKQRVAIARAFLKNAPIVILDEATSALDNKAEQIVQQAIENLMKDRTVIVIAHRLTTIQNANKIVVINEGKIIEEGTHEKLLEKGGAYATLYKTQFKKKKKGGA